MFLVLLMGEIFAEQLEKHDLGKERALGYRATRSSDIVTKVKRMEVGFGYPEKRFLPVEEIPANISERTKESVKRLCVCRVEFGLCITIFSVAEEKFLTNAHALNSFFNIHKRYFTKPTFLQSIGVVDKPDNKCDFELALASPQNKWEEVSPLILKMGTPDPSGGGGQKNWDPEKYYSIRNEDYPDNSNDLGLIYLKGVRAPPLDFEGSLSLGQRVFHSGFSAGTAVDQSEDKTAIPKVSGGVIHSIKAHNIEADFLGVNGTSGGPVLNDQGKVVGVFWGKEMTWREDTVSPFGNKFIERKEFFRINGYPRERSFFIPASAIMDFLKKDKTP